MRSMKKNIPSTNGDHLNISPISGDSMHQMTPLRTRRRKMSRKEQGTDVHTTCSTPNRIQADIQCSGFNSPSDSFLYSQEHRPDVIWDYTSPKLPKGSKKKEIKITVDEFLKNLTNHQVPECNTQSSRYIKLLEKWMTKQNTPVIKKPVKNVNRDNKKRSRRVIEEIKQFMESIQKKNEDMITEDEGKEQATENSFSKPGSSSKQPDKKSFLESVSSQNDSTDDLWGEMDNSFIIKATQELESTYSKYNVHNKNLEIESTIPETISSTSKGLSFAIQDSEQNIEVNCLDTAIVDSDYQAQILLTQIISCGWDSGSDNDDWENGFIEEDEALSLIPDEVLSGINPNPVEKLSCAFQEDKKCKPLSLNYVQSVGNSSDSKLTDSKNRSEEISFGCSETNRVSCPAVDESEAELFKNFEDESFSDESILFKPEVLSWIDQVESQASQSRLKCTPEEIKKKKDEAIQRRKKNKTKTKFSN